MSVPQKIPTLHHFPKQGQKKKNKKTAYFAQEKKNRNKKNPKKHTKKKQHKKTNQNKITDFEDFDQNQSILIVNCYTLAYQNP